MATLKEVGDSFFSDNVKHLVEEEPYWSFVLLSAMIEFMGKCYSIAKGLDSRTSIKDMQKSGLSETDFYNSINQITALKKYKIFNYKKKNKTAITYMIF